MENTESTKQNVTIIDIDFEKREALVETMDGKKFKLTGITLTKINDVNVESVDKFAIRFGDPSSGDNNPEVDKILNPFKEIGMSFSCKPLECQSVTDMVTKWREFVFPTIDKNPKED